MEEQRPRTAQSKQGIHTDRSSLAQLETDNNKIIPLCQEHLKFCSWGIWQPPGQWPWCGDLLEWRHSITQWSSIPTVPSSTQAFFFLLQSHADPKPSCIQLLPQCTECHIYCGSSGHLTSTSLVTFEQPPPYCSPYAPCLSAGLHIPHEGKNIRCILVYCPAFPASHNVPAWAHHINTS